MFPALFGRREPAFSMETWLLKGVVAPQDRRKTTALSFPSGDVASCSTSLPQRSGIKIEAAQ